MKNFVKLIEQVHAKRFSAVLNEIVTKKIPVALLSIEPIDKAVENVKNFRAQGLNVTNLFTGEFPSDTGNLEFKINHLSDAAQVYPQPEYVWITTTTEVNFAKKFAAGYKIILPSVINGLTTDQVYETFMAHLDDLREVYESLIDEESKKTFRGFWLGRISNQVSEVVYANTPQYICAGFVPERDAIVIDCGAYDGGTAVRFANTGCKVYAFEPGKDMFAVTRKLAEKNNFVVENFGLGSNEHTANFDAKLRAISNDAQQSDDIPIKTLDSYVGEKNLPRVDFIKMDVEGAELDILKGAAVTIAKYKPILALSAYHKLDDFWTLMNFVKSIRPDYEFALRQYATKPEDMSDFFTKEVVNLFELVDLDVSLPNYDECVLFAR
ncbi:MAG: FkbM family methyltransferase [Selenomonadaceae bacterium]|nr:FkbM family methyltransferase [Selenomonadaceae bacterium]